MAITQVGGEENGRISLDNAAEGDTFAIVQQGRWSFIIEAVFPVTVIKALKRDLVCRSQNGREFRFNRGGRLLSGSPGEASRFIYFADVDSSLLRQYLARAKHDRRSVKAFNVVTGLKREDMDDQLIDAIEAYVARKEASNAQA